SGRRAIHLLVDIVAKGGNLLLNIAPGPDGTWQQGAFDLLKEYAAWMKVNGEAIYSTRPISPYKEGKICFTQGKDGSIYSIYLADESEDMPERISFKAFKPKKVSSVILLGSNLNLKWRMTASAFEIIIPAQKHQYPPNPYAWVFKIKVSPN
ncbi:MAG: alpha-L-fucosidase, partial [Candidatus Aminicenantes bacterium]|nr:alpha-L-fucosidase [Candidatus Aminicenantes bacterium]